MGGGYAVPCPDLLMERGVGGGEEIPTTRWPELMRHVSAETFCGYKQRPGKNTSKADRQETQFSAATL